MENMEMLEQVSNYDQEIKFIEGFAGCVDEETEYLTKNGWMSIKNYNSEEIAIVHKPPFKGAKPYIEWQKPLAYVQNDIQEAWHVRNTDKRSNIDMVLTDEHSVPYYSSKGNWITDSMGNIAKGLLAKPNGTRGKSTSKAHIPVGVCLSATELAITDIELRLWLAIQADGSLLDNGVRFNLKKQRKIDRLRWLLDSQGIVYTDTNGANGYTRIVFYGQLKHMSKDLTPLYGVSQAQAHIVYDEIVHWDGSTDRRTGNHQYSCTVKSNIDVIQFCMTMASGCLCSISVDDRVGQKMYTGGTSYARKSVGYTVSKTNLIKNKWFNKDLERVKINGSYCFTTSSGLWLARRNGYIFVTGNSGKSTRLAELADDKTLILTPTHKAASVLMAKGVKNVYTIHAVLGLVPTLNQNYIPGKQRMQKLKKVGNSDLSTITNIFIDEFGMIPQDMLDLLLELLPATTKVTVFGDPYQLKPVDGEAIDPLIYTDNIEHLTIQHRAEAPEVVESFMRFMNYIKSGREMNLTLNPAIKHGNLNDFNPETDRVLAYTNAKVSALNKELAVILGYGDSYNYGDSLIANQIDCSFVLADHTQRAYPLCISKGKLMDQAKLIETAEEVENNINKFNTTKFLKLYSEGNISVDGHNYLIHYDIDHYATQQRLKAEIDKWQAYIYSNYDISEDVKLKDWCYQNKTKKGVKERGQAWSHYIAHSSLVFNLQRPWATTIHKSQGSSFRWVYIAQSDIKKSIRQGYYENYARLIYVALSRAEKGVTIV